MTITTDIPATQNTDWGFWGTMEEHAQAAWAIALPAIARAAKATPDAARAFLDSVSGRHFADDVLSRMHEGMGIEDAIRDAIARWMRWKIDRSTSTKFGIPRGLPYLTGFVRYHEIAGQPAQ